MEFGLGFVGTSCQWQLAGRVNSRLPPGPPAPADISSNNLLVKELARGGCHLLLSDPSMTKRICDLANPNKWAARACALCLCFVCVSI